MPRELLTLGHVIGVFLHPDGTPLAGRVHFSRELWSRDGTVTIVPTLTVTLDEAGSIGLAALSDPGAKGDPGVKGDQGDQGVKGDQGAKGDQGVPGTPGSPTAYDLRGTGSPEGVLTAAIGTRYTDTLGTNGAILWIKASGTGNTGWKVEYGDTGWRDVSASSFYKNDQVTLWPLLQGGLHVRRINGVVFVRTPSQRVRLDKSADTTSTCNIFIPGGFRMTATGVVWPWTSWDKTTALALFSISGGWHLPNSGQMNPFPAGTNEGASQTSHSWPTADAWPASLPGTPTS
mgnify:CR=1 FL=1